MTMNRTPRNNEPSYGSLNLFDCHRTASIEEQRLKLEQSISHLSLRKRKRILREFDHGQEGPKDVEALMAKVATMGDDDDDFDFGDSDYEDEEEEEEEVLGGVCESKVNGPGKSLSGGMEKLALGTEDGGRKTGTEG